MGIWKTLRTLAGMDAKDSSQSATNSASRTCHFEVMEPRRVLDADPLMIGAVYIEDDSGTDNQGDTFYVAFQGGSSTTTLTRLIIDGNQDGNPNQMNSPDVYFDIDPTNQGDGTGAGGAHGFVLSNKSVGVSASDITVGIVDGGTRIVLDIKDFKAGDVLVFTIDVDQYFANKPDDQVTSGIEFSGSSLSAVFADPHYNFTPSGAATNGIFQYNFGFGSDDVADTGVLSVLPSKEFREAINGNASIENRTAGALDQFNLTPKPITIAGNVWHDRDLDLKIDAGEEMISGVTLRLQVKDTNGNYVDVIRNGSAVSTLTDANGHYEFGLNLNLAPGTYRVLETQPAGYEYSVGEVPGTVAGSTVGVAQGNVLAEITIPLGDQHAINYDFAEAKAAQISGYVYHDRNDNGIRDAGEEGISGVQILITPISTIAGQAPITVYTDANGFYSATGLSPGQYTVTEVVQPVGFVDGKDTPGTVNGVTVGTVINPGDKLNAIVLGSGDKGIEYNFGELKYGSISGHVKIKTPEGNCVSYGDPQYRPIAGVIIELVDSSGNVIRTTTTDAEGKYSFNDLPMGTYSINEVMPAGFPYLQGTTSAGTIDGATVGLVNGDTISQIVLGAGQNGVNYDFCEPLPAKLSGYVYHDKDNDGNRDVGEPPIAGTVIELYDENGNKVAQTVTDGTGYYAFTNLYKGTYTVVERQPSGWLDGKDTAGTVSGITKGVAGQDRINSIPLLFGDEGIEFNFGELLPGSIAGRVISDTNGDCVLDTTIGDRPLAGVLIELRDAAGNVIRTARTDADGRYLFDNLPPGTYTVFENQPSGYFDSGDHIGVVKGTGVAGPGVKTVNDTLSSITLSSGTDLIQYDFCEIPAASLSGYVYQDGATIGALPGQTLSAADLYSLRDGVLTADDTRLAGVILELRNGITGEPIMASSALPGVYSSGPIRTTTDANGFYIFTGLPAGNYAVFQIQPDGYTDHVDSPGTTLGIAINPALGIDPLALSTLSAGINPNNDAILRIALGVGQQSQLNNFSEVRVETPPPPPPENPPTDPPPPFKTELPPDRFPGLYGQEKLIEDPFIRFSVFAPGNAYTWHLSVINAGLPRGNADPLNVIDPRWESALSMNREKWLSTDLTQGSWVKGNADNAEEGKAEVVGEATFGLPDGIAVTGDFNGDGIDEIAIYRGGEWFIDLNGNGRWDQQDMWAQLGTEADRPVTGDWDGDGKDDIGIYGPIWPRDPRAIEVDPGLPDPDNARVRDPKNVPPRLEDATGARALKLTADGTEREDLIDHVFAYGQVEDTPITGDWNGDGIRTIGIFRDGKWDLDLDGDGRYTDRDGSFAFGSSGDLPVVGDWNGDGIEEIGVYRGGTWILDIDGDRELEATDKVFELGGANDKPVVGDWNGDGIDDPGLYRGAPSTVQLPGPVREAG